MVCPIFTLWTVRGSLLMKPKNCLPLEVNGWTQKYSASPPSRIATLTPKPFHAQLWRSGDGEKAWKLRLGFTHSSRHNRIRFSDYGGFVALGLLRHRLSGDRTYNEAGRDGGSKKDHAARGGRNSSLIGEQSIFLSCQLTINGSKNLAIGCFIPYKEAGSNFG